MTLTRAAANSICTGGNGWSVAFTLGWTPNN
jgi:hypothetical protein